MPRRKPSTAPSGQRWWVTDGTSWTRPAGRDGRPHAAVGDQGVRRLHRRRRARPRGAPRRVLRAAGPLRLRQDHHAADGRRAWSSRRPAGSLIGAHRPDRVTALRAAGQHRLPELRALPAPGHRRATWPSGCAGAAPGTPRPRPPRRSSWCRWATWPTASRPSCPAASSSVSPLARALVNRPEVLLLDEPLGALDLKLRRQMQVELKRIQTEVGLTFIHVTHDQEEAMTMADTVAVMNAGRIEQMGAAGRALRPAAYGVRRQLPGSVQPRARDGGVRRRRRRDGRDAGRPGASCPRPGRPLARVTW